MRRAHVSGQRRYGLLAGRGSGVLEADHVEVAAAGTSDEVGDAVALHSSGSHLKHLYVHDCGGPTGRLDRRSGIEIFGAIDGAPVAGNVVEDSTVIRCVRGALIGSRAEKNRLERMRFNDMSDMNVRFYAESRSAMPRANLVRRSVFGDSVAPITIELEIGMTVPECGVEGPFVVAPAPSLEGLEWQEGTLRLRGRTCPGYLVEPYILRDGEWHPLEVVEPDDDGAFRLAIEGVGPLQKVGAIAVSPDHGTSLMSVRD